MGKGKGWGRKRGKYIQELGCHPKFVGVIDINYQVKFAKFVPSCKKKYFSQKSHIIYRHENISIKYSVFIVMPEDDKVIIEKIMENKIIIEKEI